MRRIILLSWLLTFSFLLASCNQATPTATSGQVIQTIFATKPASAKDAVWNDRSLFTSGLIENQQRILKELPNASVYHIEVKIADDYTSLNGQEQVRYTNQEVTALDTIYFQLFPNMEGGQSDISELLVDGKAIEPSFDKGNSAMRVPLTSPLEPGQSIVVQMNFAVTIPTDAGGNYGLFVFLDHLLALDGFYPAIPVYDEKGWHDGPIPPNADTTFQDASFYIVQVTAPKTMILVASGVQVERTEMDKTQTITFAAGPARDFYLAGSEDFVATSQTIGETRVNSYAFKDRADGAKLALDTASKAIESYSARFGDYPYTEFDVIASPMQGAYGIEYPGITGINQLLFDTSASISGTSAPIILESTVAHEVGHQWFYNVVGNDQANEPWLDEAVTQYVTGLYFLDQDGPQGMAGYESSWSGRWDRVSREDIPIGLPAGSYQGKEYSSIVYGRGPLFLAALAEKMGQDKFDEFLRDYYQSNEWGIGTTTSFKALAEKHCACDLTSLFDEWVYAK